MKNIFIDAYYHKNPELGVFVDKYDIIDKPYNTELEQKICNKYYKELNNYLYENKEIFNNKYIYLLVAYISSKEYGRLVKEKNIYIGLFNSEEDAKKQGIYTMKNGIKRDIMTLDNCSEDELEEENFDLLLNEEDFNYIFTIYKMKINRSIFGEVEIKNNIFIQSNTKKEQLEYYNKNLKKYNNTNENLYDFLLDLVGGYQINSYTIDGKLYKSEILDDYIDIDTFNIKSLLGYHVEKFNIKDIVKIKYDPNYKNELFVIKEKIIQNGYSSIYESNDPLHYKEGYVLYRKNDINKEVIEEIFYDEDLELVEN